MSPLYVYVFTLCSKAIEIASCAIVYFSSPGSLPPYESQMAEL